MARETLRSMENWLTVEVPPEAPPGLYAGTIQGLPQPVPVRLQVGEWLAPRPNDFRFGKGFIQSPETVGLHYKTKLWSDEHFAFLETSLRLLGQLGNDTLYLSAVGHTHLTGDYPLLRWTRNGERLVPEFTAIERYFELWDRHVGPPKYIILNILGTSNEFQEPRQLSVVGRAGAEGGTLEKGPALNDPASVDMWRAAVQGIQQRMAALGWRDAQLLWGTIHDDRNWGPDFIAFFQNVAARVAEASGQLADLRGGAVVPQLYREQQAREWTSRDGRTVTAQFLAYDGRQVRMLLPDHREVAAPLDQLSPEDEAWVREETGFRIWRNREGREIEARMLDADQDKVMIQLPDGREFQVPVHTLGAEDRAYVQRAQTAVGGQ